LLADRFDRRRVFATALMVQAMVTTALAVTLGLGVRTPAVLILLILLASAAGATGAPAYAAMVPDLVPPEELMAMVSLGVYSWNSGRIIGPMLGTALVLLVGPAWTIAFNAASFVVLAAAVALVRRAFRPAGGSAGTIMDRSSAATHVAIHDRMLAQRRAACNNDRHSVCRPHSHLRPQRVPRRHQPAGMVASALGSQSSVQCPSPSRPPARAARS
jgi:MFS family permease